MYSADSADDEVESAQTTTKSSPKTLPQLSSIVKNPSFVGFEQTIKECVVGATMDLLNAQEAKVTNDLADFDFTFSQNQQKICHCG